MEYAEVIYETGTKSVISFESLEELQGALKAHNDRALSGQPGAAQDQVERGDIDYTQAGMVHPNTAMQRPAEHVKRVILYGESHPADLAGGGVNVETLNTLIEGMADENGYVDPNQLISAIRDELSPLYPVNQGAHMSMYKAEGTEMDLGFLVEHTVEHTPEDGEDSV